MKTIKFKEIRFTKEQVEMMKDDKGVYYFFSLENGKYFTRLAKFLGCGISKEEASTIFKRVQDYEHLVVVKGKKVVAEKIIKITFNKI